MFGRPRPSNGNPPPPEGLFQTDMMNRPLDCVIWHKSAYQNGHQTTLEAMRLNRKTISADERHAKRTLLLYFTLHKNYKSITPLTDRYVDNILLSLGVCSANAGCSLSRATYCSSTRLQRTACWSVGWLGYGERRANHINPPPAADMRVFYLVISWREEWNTRTKCMRSTADYYNPIDCR